MAGDFEPEALATALARMVQDLLAQDSVQSTLERVSRHAVDIVHGCEAAGVMMLHQGSRVETLAVTSDLVAESDRIQDELGEGPCFDAVNEREPVYRVVDMAGSGQRWPRYAPKARDLGIGSMMGFLLSTEREREYLGALGLYSSEPNAFTERSEQVGWIFASHAAVAFSTARSDEQLRNAIATRQEIGEALGIVMERYSIPEGQAFEMLKTLSQERNIKLREIARMVVETGEFQAGQ